MKIIDEKGRLFGKINFVDFLVILLLVCLVPMFYFGYKIMTKNPTVVELTKGEFIEIELDCRLIKLKPEVLKVISVGDKELDKNGQVIGKIISLGQSMPYKYELDVGQGQKIIKEDAILKQLKAKLKLKVKIKGDNLYYKEKMIKIVLPFEFKTNDFIFTAIPLKEEVAAKTVVKTVDLYVTLKDLDEDTLKKISVGDKEVDETGKTIVEILSMGRIENNAFEVDLGGGHFVTVESSGKKQISTKIRLRCQVKDDDQLYFKDEQIRRGTPFEFRTDKYKVTGLVAKAFEVVSPLKQKWLSLQIKFSGVIPEIASIIQKGNLERSSSEERVEAKINWIISNKPSEVLSLEKGKFITLNHPFQKDIVASLDVLCTEKNGIYYFKNYPAKMGNNIVFATDLYSISGTIIGMEIK